MSPAGREINFLYQTMFNKERDSKASLGSYRRFPCFDKSTLEL